LFDITLHLGRVSLHVLDQLVLLLDHRCQLSPTAEIKHKKLRNESTGAFYLNEFSLS
jgi:hypothetical protein